MEHTWILLRFPLLLFSTIKLSHPSACLWVSAKRQKMGADSLDLSGSEYMASSWFLQMVPSWFLLHGSFPQPPSPGQGLAQRGAWSVTVDGVNTHCWGPVCPFTVPARALKPSAHSVVLCQCPSLFGSPDLGAQQLTGCLCLDMHRSQDSVHPQVPGLGAPTGPGMHPGLGAPTGPGTRCTHRSRDSVHPTSAGPSSLPSMPLHLGSSPRFPPVLLEPGSQPTPSFSFSPTYSVQFSRSVMSDSSRPHGLQHARLPCPSATPRTCSDSYPMNWWCHPTISSSVFPFSFWNQSSPASGSFLRSQFFTTGGQSIGASSSASVLPVNTQGWFPLGLTGYNPSVSPAGSTPECLGNPHVLPARLLVRPSLQPQPKTGLAALILVSSKTARGHSPEQPISDQQMLPQSHPQVWVRPKRRELPGCPIVKALHSQCRWHRFDPQSGN